MSDTWLIGVDGGGTKTDVWLARGARGGAVDVVGRGAVGSSNPRAVGLPAALAQLELGIQQAFAAAQRPVQTVDAAVLAMSGAGRPEVQAEIQAWFDQGAHARRLAQVHDAEAVLAAGIPEGWGAAVIVGTGSAVVGTDAAGRRATVGGWGYWFGDEGSAYWIGRRALDLLARAADGRRAASPLADATLAALQIDEPRDALAALERRGDVRSAIAALAPEVTRLAEAGDADATDILVDGAGEVAEAIAAVARRLSLPPQFPLAITGGVACGSATFREQLARALARRGVGPRSLGLGGNPVGGFLRLAQKLAAEA